MITNPKLASFSDEDLIAELKYRGYGISKHTNRSHCEKSCSNCNFLNNYPKCFMVKDNSTCEDWMKAPWIK